MSIHRVEAHPSLFPLPSRMPEFRRCCCVCGCGRWWYSPRTPGRPPAYATPDCYRRERSRRRYGVARAPFQESGTHLPYGGRNGETAEVPRGQEGTHLCGALSAPNVREGV